MHRECERVNDLLRAENDALKLRVGVLEKALAERDATISAVRIVASDPEIAYEHTPQAILDVLGPAADG